MGAGVTQVVATSGVTQVVAMSVGQHEISSRTDTASRCDKIDMFHLPPGLMLRAFNPFMMD